MAGYIEKEAAIEILRKSHKSHAENYRDEVLLLRDIRLLKEMPAADVVEVRHARWVEDELTYCGAGRCNYKCSVCGKTVSAARRETTEHLYPYCPFCGAKMGGERSENE